MAWMTASMVASLASMVASMALGGGFDGLDGFVGGVIGSAEAHAAEPRSDEERVDGLSHKICEERADGLMITWRIREEGADELTLKSDGERVERLTHKIRDSKSWSWAMTGGRWYQNFM